jgi:hypothetical protein
MKVEQVRIGISPSGMLASDLRLRKPTTQFQLRKLGICLESEPTTFQIKVESFQHGEKVMISMKMEKLIITEVIIKKYYYNSEEFCSNLETQCSTLKGSRSF